MARKTKAEAEATRQAIIKAAAEVFIDKGVAKASLEEIAERAGVTRGAVYWHFKNKLDIFQAMHDNLHTPFFTRIVEDLETNHPHPLNQLKELATHLLEDLAKDEETRNILTVFFIKCDYTGELSNVLSCLQTQKDEKEKLFQTYFNRAKQKGFLSQEVDPYLLTKSFSCYTNGILIEYLHAPDRFDLAKLAKPLMDEFFKAYD